jgi:acetylornithine deacetylase/succinyl-diaminopimelate desuccinylase-like protein
MTSKLFSPFMLRSLALGNRLVVSPRRPHGIDERVDLDSVRAITRTMALFLVEWCGIERS